MGKNPKLAVVAPFFNEEETLPTFVMTLASVISKMDVTCEVILVDDGSTDHWRQSLPLELSGINIRIVELVGNSGHQAALDAGLRATTADYVVTLDSDLQHPPDEIPKMLALAQETGCDVVYARRVERSQDSVFKRLPSVLFYRLMRWLSDVQVETSAADFRLMSRFVVDILNAMPDRKVFRLLLPSLNFTSSTIEYTANRRYAGKSKYGVLQMVGLARTSILQFSVRPLRLVAAFGMLTSLLAAVWLAVVLLSWLSGSTVTGWTSLMGVNLLVGGVVLFSLGIIGEYVGQIYVDLQARPHFIVKKEYKLGDSYGD